MLSSPTCPVLEALGKKLSFEIAVGLNGRVWVKADSPSTNYIVVNAIIKSESLSGAQQKIMAEKLHQKIQGIYDSTPYTQSCHPRFLFCFFQSYFLNFRNSRMIREDCKRCFLDPPWSLIGRDRVMCAEG
ncbi:hypothetical protein NC652_035020 [Populus alba x Populus x berolinensis]|nr:hypothetical protein NC652_035020 [Populus alba x Populus x berolinensis]